AHSATGHRETAGAGALTIRTNTDVGPRAVEVAATSTTTAAFAGRLARRVGVGLAATRRRRAIGLDRARRGARTGDGFVVVADAAPGAALREHNIRCGHDEDENETAGRQRKNISHGHCFNPQERPVPSAHTEPIIRQVLPALPHSLSAASRAV